MPTEVVDVLRDAPDRVPALVRAALGTAAAAAGVATSQARLVLAVDQMEELFTTHAEPAPRETLVRLISVLASSGLVWVMGTIRGDFFHRCSEIPGLSALKEITNVGLTACRGDSWRDTVQNIPMML